MHRRIPTIIAFLALFIALSGSATAAIKLAKGSVTTREIKDRSVRTRDLAPSARAVPLTKAKTAQVVEEVLTDPQYGLQITVHGDKGDAGAQGPAGPAGPQGADAQFAPYMTEDANYDIGTTPLDIDIRCPEGTAVLSAGAYSSGNISIVSSIPKDTRTWTLRVQSSDGSLRRVVARAICAPLSAR